MSADLNARLTLDNRQFIQGLRQANAGQGNFNSQLGGAAGGAGRAAGAVKALAGSYLALQAAQAGFRMGKEALFKAGALESETARLEVLLGSVEEAEKLMGRVMGMAGGTPLETTELQQATRTLIALGSEADSVLDELEMMGDISQGVGMEINELANIYGKMRSKGVIQAEELNQLAERGIPIIAEFAQQLGVSEGEVRKLASEGKITFENLQEGFKNLTGDGGKFNNMMERMSTTLEGQLSTLRDNFDQLVMIPMGQWVDSWVRPMVEGLNESADLLRRFEEARRQGGDKTSDFESRIEDVSTGEDREKLKQDLARASKMALIKVNASAAEVRKFDEDGNVFQKPQADAARKLLEERLTTLEQLQDLHRKMNTLSDETLAKRQAEKEAEAALKREAEERLRLAELAAAREAAGQEITEDDDAREDERRLKFAVESGDREELSEILSEAKDELAELQKQWRATEDPELIEKLPEKLADAKEKVLDLADTLKAMDSKAETEREKKLAKEKAEAEKLANNKTGRVRAPEVDQMMRIGLSLGGDLQMPNLEKEQLSETRRQTQVLADIKKNTTPSRTKGRDKTSRWS
jgi:tape measure domain-containing protein